MAYSRSPFSSDRRNPSDRNPRRENSVGVALEYKLSEEKEKEIRKENLRRLALAQQRKEK